MVAHASARSWGGRNAGVVVYDLETIHNAARGTYHEKGMYECSKSEQILWKRASQIIEFGAVIPSTGASISVQCRPDFFWEDVQSEAARCFALDHGHDRIVKDPTLPCFQECWLDQIVPFLEEAAGDGGDLAMIAHGGDAFDHFVLRKELDRAGLSSALRLNFEFFDPIRTLKAHFGSDYGMGGQLALKKLHSQRVPRAQQQRLWQHRALSDCYMLLEVLDNWPELGSLLSHEIENQLSGTRSGIIARDGATPTSAAVLRRCLDLPACERCVAAPPGPVALLESMLQGRGHKLRISAAEFVPGAPYTPAALVLQSGGVQYAAADMMHHAAPKIHTPQRLMPMQYQ